MQLESQAPANRAGFYCIAIVPCRGPHRRLTTITIGYDSGDLRDTWHCSQHYKTILGLPSFVPFIVGKFKKIVATSPA